MLSKWIPFVYLIYHIVPGVRAGKNSVIGINTKCDQDSLNVTLLFSEGFRGVAFSKGFSRKCNSTGTGSERLALTLSTSSCGVRITKAKDTGMLVVSAVVEVQMSASLQQAEDPSLPVSCSLKEDMLILKTKKLLPNSRTGRGMANVGKAWMEVKGSAISTLGHSQPLSVGEHTTLAVYTSLPGDLVGEPIECAVHDGHGTKQPLSDAAGCPVEPTLVPKLRYDSSTGTWATGFPAFSFPDYQLVHYTCKLRICKTACPVSDCENDTIIARNSRTYHEEEEERVLDVVDLYNSVEVTAPNIELGYLKREPPTEQFEGVAEGGGGLCLPGRGVALLLASLGSLFLLALLISVLIMLKNRAAVRPPPFVLLRPHSPVSLWSI